MSGSDLFINLRRSLAEQLVENSENSIETAVNSLAWNDSIYRSFNEGLRLAQKRNKRDKIPNSLVEYIHITHFSHTVVVLRKLYDEKRRGPRSVNSIRSITKRLIDNKHLLCREYYLIHDGTPFENKKGFDWKTNQIIQSRHEQFDSLCGLKVGSKRKSDDKIAPLLIDKLHQKAVLNNSIREFVNKFVAHASANNNRPNEELVFKQMKLSCIQNQYRNLIWAVQQIAKIVDEVIITEVPEAQFDVFTNWDRGLFDRSIKKALQRYWEQRTNWWQKWTAYYQNPGDIFISPRKKLTIK